MNIITVLILLAILLPRWGVICVIIGFGFLTAADLMMSMVRTYRAQQSAK
jgi:hypothetical protein